MTINAEQLIKKKVRITIEDKATAPKKSLRGRLAKALFLLEQEYWGNWLKQCNKVEGLLGNVRITYKTITWEKLAQRHRIFYYNQADTVTELMKEEQK